MPPLSEAMRRYRVLEDDLRLVRSENAPGSPSEDPIIEEMARLWWDLSDIEREQLDSEGPTCWPAASGTDGGTDLDLTDKDTTHGSVDGAFRVRGAS